MSIKSIVVTKKDNSDFITFNYKASVWKNNIDLTKESDMAFIDFHNYLKHRFEKVLYFKTHLLKTSTHVIDLKELYKSYTLDTPYSILVQNNNELQLVTIKSKLAIEFANYDNYNNTVYVPLLLTKNNNVITYVNKGI